MRQAGAAVTSDLQVGGTALDQTIGQPGEVDVLTLQINQSGRYRVSTGGGADTVLFIFDQANTSQALASNDDADGSLTSRIDIDLGVGSYFAVVRLYSSFATGDYSVRVEQLS